MLSTAQWQVILAGARLREFAKDDVILKEGVMNRSIFRIKKGSVQLEIINEHVEGSPSQVTPREARLCFQMMLSLWQA